MDVALVSRSSRWLERSAAGATLLTEHGPLTGLSLGWHEPFDGFSARLGWQGVRGVRSYDGQTMSGTPVATGVDLQEDRLELALRAPLASDWTLGLQIEPTQLRRHLRSTATASGYPERWRWTLLQVDLAGHRAVDSGVELAWRLGYGALLAPRVVATFPGRDPVTLVPSRGRQVSASLDASGPLMLAPASAWRWQCGLAWSAHRFDASGVSAVTSNGTLSGGAVQPETELRDLTLRLGVSARWP